MKKLGLYCNSAIDELNSREEIELIDCIEGCLLDSLLFYDCKTEKYYMCLEHYQNSWSSCYEVYYGTEEEIYQKWDKIREELEAVS